MERRKILQTLLIIVFLAAPSVTEGAAVPRHLPQREAAVRAIADTFTEYNRKLSMSTAKEYAKHVMDASLKFKEDPFVVAALVIVESTVKANAYSNGNYGLMQIRWKSHKNELVKKFPGIRREKDLFKPRENIMAGVEILSEYKSKSVDIAAALKKYSGGSSSHFSKVQRYVREMETKAKKYR